MELLAKNPSAELQVYAVWMPILPRDARSKWDDRLLPDPRVTHFWDEERITGFWFAQEVQGYQGLAWDVFYLYGPEADWDVTPSPLIGTGTPVIGAREALERELLSLLGT